MLREAAGILLHLGGAVLFPRSCLLCGKPFQPWEELLLCRACGGGLHPIPPGRRCLRCSRPLISEHEVCTRCRGRSYPFTANHSLFEYRGAVRTLIHRYKTAGHRELCLLFAALMAPVLAARYAGVPVVPVPASRASVRRRGWDHVDILAAELARRQGVQRLAVLRRAGAVQQKRLDYAGRLRNIHGSMRLRPQPLRLPREVVLLDDVFTSGATAAECAGVLAAAGAQRVHVLTLALD